MQSRRQSLIEACVGTTIGYIVALLTQFFVYWLWDIPVSLGQNLSIGLVFTVVSLIRSYWVRRLFNYLHRVIQ